MQRGLTWAVAGKNRLSDLPLLRRAPFCGCRCARLLCIRVFGWRKVRKQKMRVAKASPPARWHWDKDAHKSGTLDPQKVEYSTRSANYEAALSLRRHSSAMSVAQRCWCPPARRCAPRARECGRFRGRISFCHPPLDLTCGTEVNRKQVSPTLMHQKTRTVASAISIQHAPYQRRHVQIAAVNALI